MYRIGLILGPAVFAWTVIEWILRFTHYFELIEKALPWTERMISPTWIWVTMTVGILIFVAAWAEHKKEKDEERKHRELILKDSTPPALANIDQKISPVNTVDASQKVEIHNHPPFSPVPTTVPPNPERPEAKHNVQFRGARKIWTDGEREIFTAQDGIPAIKACFLNEGIPGTKISDFDYARARVHFRNNSGDEIAEIPRAKWLDHGIEEAVHIEGNCKKCLLLAIFGEEDGWHAPFITTTDAPYWESTPLKTVATLALPAEELVAEIFVVGAENISLDTARVRLLLLPGGNVEIKRL